MVFGQLDFDGLGVRADRSLCVQSCVRVVQPGLQLREGMLELTQGQQGSLKLVLWWRRDIQKFRLKNRNSNIWTVMKSSCQIHAILQNANKDQRHQLPWETEGSESWKQLQTDVSVEQFLYSGTTQ